MAPTQDEEMVMTRNTGGGTVSRILMVSPEQNEMLRRNRSRIFVTTARESTIDSVLFAGFRPIEDFIPAAARAIQMSGLKDIASEDIQLAPAFEHNATAGFMQQHLVSRGWLEDKDNNVVDLIIELELQDASVPDIDMRTFDAPNPIDESSENPLCIFCGVEDLYPQLDEGEQESSVTQIAQPQPQEPAVASNGNGSGRGRVKDPANDKRLTRNRESAMARQTDQGSTAGTTTATAAQGSTARMAGKPGRVARPWDGRLSKNRLQASGSAGGR